MTSNTTGTYPIDPTTSVGLFRSELGDIVAANIDNVNESADYEFVSDAYLSALLTAYPTSPLTALARAMISMANQMIAAAQNIQVSDIKINTIDRANAMLKSAEVMLTNANLNDNAVGFSTVPLKAASDFGSNWPQGSPYPYIGPNGPNGVPHYTGPSGF